MSKENEFNNLSIELTKELSKEEKKEGSTTLQKLGLHP